MQDTEPYKLPLIHEEYIKANITKEKIEILISKLNIKKLEFRYKRTDRDTLIGCFASFKFDLFGVTNNEKSELRTFTEIIYQVAKEKGVPLIDYFKNDNYEYDYHNAEIVRKIYNEKLP